MGYKVAVVGATGNVGREMLSVLHERGFPADEVVAIASRRSLGTEVSYGDGVLKVKALEQYDFADTDIVLMSAGTSQSREYSPKRCTPRSAKRSWLKTSAAPAAASP